MPKSTALNFTQNINNVHAEFFSSDTLRVVAVSTLSAGTGTLLNTGTRTFTAVAGTVPTGGVAASWTAPIIAVGVNNQVVGQPTIVNGGNYTVTPTAAGNLAISESGSGTSNATWNLRVEIYKELYTASSNDAVVKAINVASLDAIRVMSLWIVGADNQPVLLGVVSIPANAGNSGAIPAVDLLGGTLIPSLPYDANGKRIIPLKAGQKLAVSVPTVGAGTQINVSAMIEEY